MRILIGHNHYQWSGGEDAVVISEGKLLESAGHEVCYFEADNVFIQNVRGPQVLRHASAFFWSKESYSRLRKAIQAFKPDVAHFHNIYFSLTPSVYDACRDERVAVVQSLHNFRMLCVNAFFFREGVVCEDCMVKSVWQGIRHRCYRGSTLASGAMTAMNVFHRWRKTWATKVDIYITATDFTRRKYIQAGLEARKILVKPNVVYPDIPFVQPGGKFVLYVGRLSREKGVIQLLEAWAQLPHIPLKLMGDGPLAEPLRRFVAQKGLSHVEFLGHVNKDKYEDYMRHAKFVVIPSQCYENFPRIVVEAFAFGLPVLASRLGSLEEIVTEGQTGYLFDPLKVDTLRLQAQRMWQMDIAHMSPRVRGVFEQRYGPAVNLRQLLDIYARAEGSYGKTN